MSFFGVEVERSDFPWLTEQLFVIYRAMRDGEWRQLETIHELTGVKPATAGAQLRNLRRHEHGAYDVRRERAVEHGLDPKKGRHAYWLGKRGEGNPERHTCERSRTAESYADQLADALEELSPGHPLLARWDAERWR